MSNDPVYQAAYRAANRERIRKGNRAYMDRKRTDPAYREMERVRQRVYYWRKVVEANEARGIQCENT